MRAAKRGMLLGKFMPPHLGHVYMGEFARNYVDDLAIVVGTLAREPISGGLRFRWMKELFPDCSVIHLSEELPQSPEEDPEHFWDLWKTALEGVLPWRPDVIFASEEYGQPLAEVLGGKFVPVDIERVVMPVSGTAVREDPMSNWDYIPRCVRPYYVKRVCIFGPESTGKTTLARDLARHFETVFVPEYAQSLIARQGGRLEPFDIELMARAQIASEDALSRAANRVLVCDSDLITTQIWSERLFGHCPEWIKAEADRRSYDLYLLCDIDVPWVADLHRFLPRDRENFLETCTRMLSSRNRPFVRIRGNWEERFEMAAAAVLQLLSSGSAHR